MGPVDWPQLPSQQALRLFAWELAAERLRGRTLGRASYGLGIAEIDGVFGGDWIMHWGGLPGWQSMVAHNNETGVTVAIVVTTCGGEENFLTDILPQLYPR